MRCGKSKMPCNVKHECEGRNPHECAVANLCLRRELLALSKSQPARMRCGKSVCSFSVAVNRRVATRTNALWQIRRNPYNPCQIPVATRTNALWQSYIPYRFLGHVGSRNPHECAVAKCAQLQKVPPFTGRNPHECAVAKLIFCFERGRKCPVATRTNALWQSHRNPRMWGCLQSRNPHECAVAKLATATITNRRKCRNPHECAVAKSDAILRQVADRQRRNPHECAVAKKCGDWSMQ